MDDRIGLHPNGLWPSEGSVSDEALTLAAEIGFRWFATDNGVLGRTLNQNPNPMVTYRPYLWQQGGRSMHGIFRDHYLSDLIGFVYARMGAAEAASHFLDRIRENCRPILQAVVTLWCRSFSMARTPGNTTNLADARSSVSCTGALLTTVK